MAAGLALVDGYHYTGRSIYRHAFLLVARRAAAAITHGPSPYLNYVFDAAAVYGMVAYACLLAYELSGDAADLQRDEAVIERAQQETWDGDAGLYRWQNTIDWPNAFMIMALSKRPSNIMSGLMRKHSREPSFPTSISSTPRIWRTIG